MTKRSKQPRDQQALLSLVEAPIRSDQLPGQSMETAQERTDSAPKKKKGWRQRLFGKSKKGKVDDNEPEPVVERDSPKLAQTNPQTTEIQLPTGNSTVQPSPEKRDDRSSKDIADGKAPSPKPQLTPVLRSKRSNSSPKDVKGSSNSPLSGVAKQIKNRTVTPHPRVAMKQSVVDVLQRPFGREALLTDDQIWIVQVGAAEWEAEESIWKYRIGLQRRVQTEQEEVILQDLTNSLTFRSLVDFFWLEQALHSEFQGGLLLPSLTISLGVPADLDSVVQHEVDARLLTNWLSDVLNGIRGQGEWVIASSIDWMASEAMEAFLYRTDLSTVIPTTIATPTASKTPGGSGPPSTPCATVTGTQSNHVLNKDGNKENNDGFFSLILNGELCGTCSKPLSPQNQPPTQTLASRKNPLLKVHCSSKALSNAQSLDVQDSFVELATFDKIAVPPIARYAELLRSERELVWSWRARALQTMEKLRVLQEEEKLIGVAWKRFGITIATLFAYEKEVESVRLGDSKGRKGQPKQQQTQRDLIIPFRKLQKSTVDDVLRIMSRQKVERCTPSLDLLNTMLSAYVADLSAVQPSVQSYLEGLEQWSEQSKTVEAVREGAKNAELAPSAGTFAEHFQAGFDQVKRQIMSDNPTTDGDEMAAKQKARVQQQEALLQAMEEQILNNEEMLQDHLTALCRIAPFRTARMAFGFIKCENKQAGASHGAAVTMRTKINVANKDALAKMMNRHHREVKEDQATELQLVQRMVNLGNTKKFSKSEDGVEEVERGVEISTDMDNEKGELRDHALVACQERIGRWDSKVAMAILEAVGVQDANVRVEETTRDLRLVRKYAIGLRENLQRCMEALEFLRAAILKGNYGDIRDLRHEFMGELQSLLSASYLPNEQPNVPLNTQTLEEVGISINDPLGWRQKESGCGGCMKSYVDCRESGTEWLLDSFGELFKDYNFRVESVESFVYMECVGIQLEKNFSQQRATALAAFEKKTDITSAINIATRKRMPNLVKELQVKLEGVGADVSHTTVKESKEAHLESKKLKDELHDLSMRRLGRARESATERVINIMSVWAKEEEGSANTELEFLTDLKKTLTQSVGSNELNVFLESTPPVAEM